MAPRRLRPISCASRWARAAPAGSRSAITISALGFLSQSMLTAPRVYYAMARDGLFFDSVGKLFGKAEAPVVAIVLQGFAAIVIACSGTYGEILNFEVTVDFIFFGMTAASLFILRRRDRIGRSYLSRARTSVHDHAVCVVVRGDCGQRGYRFASQ